MVERLGTSSTSTDPLIGRVIDRFVLIALLGEGGMGRVYLAEHQESSHSRCVIKVMHAQYGRNAQMIQRFANEAKTTARLKHDNVVKLENFGVLDDGIMFLRFEYLEGETLEKHLSSHGGKLPLHRMFQLFLQALDALDYAHSQNVVHRDLKPENMFVMVHPRMGKLLKLLDFGICKDLENQKENTNSGMAMGTPFYMALEQYVNAASANRYADSYSMGIVGWEMLTGRLPWGRPDRGVLYHKQLTETPEIPTPSEMPPRIARVFLKCFATRPEDRPTMEELARMIASEIPAVGRAPSGVEMMANIVPRWVVSAGHFTTTLQNAAEVDRIPPMIWTQHETAPEASRRPLHAKAPDTTPSPVTAPARLARAPNAQIRPRTVAGEIVTRTSPGSRQRDIRAPLRGAKRRWSRWTLTGLGLTVGVIAAMTCFGLVRLGARVMDGHSEVAPRLPADLGRGASVSPSPPPPDVGRDRRGAAVAATAPEADARPFPRSPAVVPPDAGMDARDVRADAPRAVQPTVIVSPAPPPLAPVAPPAKPTRPSLPKPGVSQNDDPRRPAAVATGQLIISIDPYAVVFLDNRKLGGTPIDIQAPVGRHRLLLVNKDLGIEKSIGITISPDTPTRVEESW